MATTFEVIYLGQFADMDPTEGDQQLSTAQVNNLLATYGSSSAMLGAKENIVEWSPVDFSGGTNADVYEMDNSVANDTFSINGGPAQTVDSSMVFSSVITYGNGTTENITAVVTQDTDGNLYWVPESSQNADAIAIEASASRGGIQSLELVSPIYANGVNGAGYGLTADRYAADIVPCFAQGTMIRTDKGEVAIEDLVVGDMVETRDNGFQPISWIGSRDVALPDDSNLQPIRIKAGALGENTPSTDLLVSPQHRIMVRSKIAQKMFSTNEVLVAAKQLCQIDGIDKAVELGSVRYFHMLFRNHEIVISNGAETESLYTGPEALKGIGEAARREIFAIFPELEQENYELAPARKLVSGRMARKMAVRHKQNSKSLVG